MSPSARLLPILLATSLTTAYAEDFSRTLQVGEMPHISIHNGSGDIRITSSNLHEVKIVGHVRAEKHWGWSSSNADVHAVVSNPPIQQHGDTVSVGAKSQSSPYRNLVIDYDIVLPSRASVETQTGSGNIHSTGLSNSYAATTGLGDIELNGGSGEIRLETGSGSIRVKNLSGGAHITTGSGDIELQQIATGDVEAKTGSGSIRLHHVQGGLRAATGSGDIEADGTPNGMWRAATGVGSIRINLGQNAHFRVDAQTNSGTIRIQQIDLAGDLKHVTQSIHGGGPTLQLATGSGDIEIR